MYNNLSLDRALLYEVLKHYSLVPQLRLPQQLVVPQLYVHFLLAEFVEGASELYA